MKYNAMFLLLSLALALLALLLLGVAAPRVEAAAPGADRVTLTGDGAHCLQAPSATYTLSVGLGGTGSGVVSSVLPGMVCPGNCTQAYAAGSVVTLTAAPALSSIFVQWSGACAGIMPQCEVTLDADKTVTATFDVTPTNRPPVADAGPNQFVLLYSTLVLDGSGSFDPEGDDLGYLWAQSGGPTMTFGADESMTSFTLLPFAGLPPLPWVLTFTLTVTDTAGLTGTDTIVVAVVESGVIPAPLTGVSISGPMTAPAGLPVPFRAVVAPLSATWPILYTWVPEPDAGQHTSTAIYTWALTGTHLIKVFAENGGSPVGDLRAIAIVFVDFKTRLYLPLILK
ncbi:MAG: hypothetical protein JXA21_18615 [Anaerolineae bacterium]|nr:hypothetical protein [Anaerolineae bacterium]